MKISTLFPSLIILVAGMMLFAGDLQAVNNDGKIPTAVIVNPVVDFSATATLIPVGNNVTFTDQSTGTPVSWVWSFPGGAPGTYTGKIPPPITYNAAGTYDVSLTVTYPDNVVITENKAGFVQVNNYPDGWNVIRTGSTHLISVPSNVSFPNAAMVYGDFIGVFYLDQNSVEKCGGAAIWDGVNSKAVIAYGDDNTTTTKDGFAVGENLVWKVWKAISNDNRPATVTYNSSLPNNNGLFADNGMSALTSINFTAAVPLNAQASALPLTVCNGSAVQLGVTVSGGNGNYTFSWSSDPQGFSSNVQNPQAFPFQQTVYTVVVSDGQNQVSSSVTVDVVQPPVAQAGANVTICAGSLVSLSGTVAGNCGFQWSTGGDGSFSGTSVVNPQYTPGPNDILNGSVQLCLSASPCSPCSQPAVSCLTVTIRSDAQVNIIPQQLTACYGQNQSFNGLVQASGYSSILWSTPNGGGTFFPSASSLQPMYVPSPSFDYPLGCIQIVVVVQSVNPCLLSAQDQVTLCFQPLPEADLPGDATICYGDEFQLEATASDFCGIQWLTDGDGSFSDPAALNATYTPGPEDALSGVVEICLVASACNPCTASAMACMNIFIQNSPAVNIIPDQISVCTDQSLNLAGLVEIANYSAIQWSTAGDGVFTPAADVPEPVYIPGPEDLAGGCVQLAVTLSPIEPCFDSAQDQLMLCFQEPPTAYAGEDATVCSTDQIILTPEASNHCGFNWETSGDGIFQILTGETVIYLPGEEDLMNGEVILCFDALPCGPCAQVATDCVTITFVNPPQVNIIPDLYTICHGETMDFTGLTAAANYSEILWWTEDGGGIFTPGNNILEPTYIPNPEIDYPQGCIEIFVSVQPISPCTVAGSDSFTLCFQPLPEVFAGDDMTLCKGDDVILTSSTQNGCGFYWESTGDGKFDDPLLPTPVYAPGDMDLLTGQVSLCLTVLPCAPCAEQVTDCITITFTEPPFADILPEETTICVDATFDFAGYVAAGNYSTLEWGTKGDGIFLPGNDVLEPVYVPGPEDLTAGCVELNLTAAPEGVCINPAEDMIHLCFQPLPVADAGADFTACPDDLILLSPTVTNECGLLWTTAGTGYFDDPFELNARYFPGIEDIANGEVQICLAVTACEPCAATVTDCVTLHFGKTQTITIPAGWSGISSFIEPFESDIEVIMSPAIQELIIMYNLDGQMLFPADEVNTIIDWDRLSGYVIKTSGETQITLCGDIPADNTIQLTAGWNLLPVLSETSVSIDELFTPVMNKLVIIKEVAGVSLYYPEFEINTLNALQSGKAYFIKVSEDCSINY